MNYSEFLHRKSQLGSDGGFAPIWMPDCMFDFQAFLVDWAIRRGRSSINADCGLGKTLMQLVWAENVYRHTNKPVIILAPLAVGQQTVREGEKFGIEVEHSRDGKHKGGIVITNYERLHYFDSSEFIGAVADESSAIKAFDGKRRKQVTRFFNKLPYRLLCTATPSPNDFIEMGTQSECLGIMTQSDMLGFFFRENENRRHSCIRDEKYTLQWIFKPHSERPFWRWVSSWARALQKPSDLGFSDEKFVLPPLNYHHHIVDVPWIPAGELFPRPAISLAEQREERKRTVNERCEKVAELVANGKPAIVWCHYNNEADLCEKMIPDSVQVAGRDDLDTKEERLTAFARGDIRVLVTKPKIGCWGLNLQHCADMTFFPTHSYEGFYQGVRRCWRFGQTKPVNVHVVSTDGESKVISGLERKQDQAVHMFASVVKHVHESMELHSEDNHNLDVIVPSWLDSSRNGGVQLEACTLFDQNVPTAENK